MLPAGLESRHKRPKNAEIVAPNRRSVLGLPMKPLRLFPTLIFTLAAAFASAAENAAPPSTPAVTPAAVQPSQAARRATALLKELKLADAGKEARVRAILESHFAAMEKWHAINDPVLTPLWSEW